jgi:predicted alpha-1,2-mannosidase
MKHVPLRLLSLFLGMVSVAHAVEPSIGKQAVAFKASFAEGPVNWMEARGAWERRDGRLVVKTAVQGGGDERGRSSGAILFAGDGALRDAVVTLSKTTRDGDVFNLLGRAQDEDNCVQFGRRGRWIELSTVRGGHARVIGKVALPQDALERLTLRMVGNCVRAYHNDVLLFARAFERGDIPESGKFGIQANHVGAGFGALAMEVVDGGVVPAVDGLLRLVNTLQGTDSEEKFSHGNTLPLVGTPWSMTDWCPQTYGDNNTRWFYRPGVQKILGFRATHQPSPFMADYGNVLFMPQTGPLVVGPADRGSDYDLGTSIQRPDYLRVVLPRYGVTAELTASERCGVMRITYEGATEGRLLIDPAGESSVEFVGRRFQGFTRFRSNPAPENYATYFVGELDRDVLRSGSFAGGTGKESDRPTSGMRVAGYLEFDTGVSPVVEVRIATSHISIEQAVLNLESETRGGFEAVRARTAQMWEEHLGRIVVEAGPEQMRTFYSCLYRALKFPHRFHELDSAGKMMHFSPFDGRVHDGPAYVDSGLWDTFRTQFPFLSVVYPERLGEIVEGWCNAYREGGWLPQWPSPGGTGGMVGTHSDAVIADAIVKGIPGFDVATAYAAIRHDAFDIGAGPSGGGRNSMQEYLALGYVPARSSRDWVSATLDFAYDDWCVAQAAKALGKDNDHAVLMRRAQNYRNLWDPEAGFMRSRNGDGTWDGAFDEFAWGRGFCECSPWQGSWAVQHDAEGLSQLLGGRAALASKLDKLFSQPPVFHLGDHGGVIHEMREMAAVKMGQWAQNNQPAFHLPYLYAAAGQPWKTEYWTRRACAELYGSEPQHGYPGDEDNGSSASWYLLSALGFYPLTPGHPSYVVTSPAVRRAVIAVAGGKTFVISAAGNDDKAVFVRRRLLNGREHTRAWIGHAEIVHGGSMEVELADKPGERVLAGDDLPYSASLNP